MAAEVTRRYLSISGGRLGNTTTRQQLCEIARDYARSGKYTDLQSDGYGPEEYITPEGGYRGTYVDLTARDVYGNTIRIQTVDTLADGVTPTARESFAATRIKAPRPLDRLILIPKRLP